MKTLPIKPLSVNEAWQGRRFKTKKYAKYIYDVCLLLPPMEIPEGPLAIEVEWGFSNVQSDVDNPVKCFIDCLQKKYGFNDSRVYQLIATKEITKKGSDYIRFEITDYRKRNKGE